MRRFKDERDWFFAKRFGLFIHWGIYSVGGVHEQEQQRCNRPAEHYRRYARRFHARGYNPDAWLDLAERCGMEYLTFTTKHHDGFCLWNTAECDYNVMNTPCGKDVLAELAAACQKRNMPLSLYYSVVDWHQATYPNLGRGHEIVTDARQHDFQAYLRYMTRQIRELCTRYGKIHGIWWDMNTAQGHDPAIHPMIRKWQPAAVINNRGLDAGDFSTPERDFQADPTLPFTTPTECCDSVGSGSWGYCRTEDYHSVSDLEHKIARNLALGGNFLLNVGPDAAGVIPGAPRRLLEKIGQWYLRVKPGVTAPPLHHSVENGSILCTGDEKKLYLILLELPDSSTLRLPPLKKLPRTVRLLNFPAKIEATLTPILYERNREACLRLRKLPIDRLHGTVPVIELQW